jgi:hypothetical protein
MADSLAACQAERTRLMSGGRLLSARVEQSLAELQAGEARLFVKDSRSETGGENEALTALGYTPGSWHLYSPRAECSHLHLTPTPRGEHGQNPQGRRLRATQTLPQTRQFGPNARHALGGLPHGQRDH